MLVSKDINMRIKATTLGIPAEDYFNDKVLDDTDMLYSVELLGKHRLHLEELAGSKRHVLQL